MPQPTKFLMMLPEYGLVTSVRKPIQVADSGGGWEVRVDSHFNVNLRTWQIGVGYLKPDSPGGVDDTYRTLRKFYEDVAQHEAFYWWDPEENPAPTGITDTTGRHIVRFDGYRLGFVYAGSPRLTARYTLQEIQATGPVVLTASLPNGNVGVAYSVTLKARDGAPPYTWAVTAGSLPPGLALTPGGLLSGTPTAGGTYSFTIGLTDRQTPPVSDAVPYTVVIS